MALENEYFEKYKEACWAMVFSNNSQHFFVSENIGLTADSDDAFIQLEKAAKQEILNNVHINIPLEADKISYLKFCMVECSTIFRSSFDMGGSALVSLIEIMEKIRILLVIRGVKYNTGLMYRLGEDDDLLEENENWDEAVKSEEKLSYAELALAIYYMQAANLTESVDHQNKDEIGKRYSRDGQILYQKYYKIISRIDRIGTTEKEKADRAKLRRFQKVMTYLNKHPKALEKANEEYQIFKNAYDRLYF